MLQTIRQTANTLKVPERFIRNLVAEGTCPGLYSGNRFLVNVEMFREWLDKECCRTKANGDP